MARPADHEKRRELARRAARVLQEQGLEISLAGLADALEIKRPTLLYYFPTKSHIVEAALEDLLTEQAAFVLGKIAEHEHPIDRLYAQLRAVHEFHRGKEARVVFLSQAIATSAGPRLAEILESGARVFEPYRRAAVKQIRAGIADGTIAEHDPEALLAVVRATIDGLMIQRVTSGVNLAPVHDLIWDRLLAPLKLEAKRPRRK